MISKNRRNRSKNKFTSSSNKLTKFWKKKTLFWNRSKETRTQKSWNSSRSRRKRDSRSTSLKSAKTNQTIPGTLRRSRTNCNRFRRLSLRFNNRYPKMRRKKQSHSLKLTKPATRSEKLPPKSKLRSWTKTIWREISRCERSGSKTTPNNLRKSSPNFLRFTESIKFAENVESKGTMDFSFITFSVPISRCCNALTWLPNLNSSPSSWTSLRQPKKYWRSTKVSKELLSTSTLSNLWLKFILRKMLRFQARTFRGCPNTSS